MPGVPTAGPSSLWLQNMRGLLPVGWGKGLSGAQRNGELVPFHCNMGAGGCKD